MGNNKEITREDIIRKFKKARDAKRTHLEEMEKRMRIAYKLRTGEDAKLEDFRHIEAPVREAATRKNFVSFYRVKPGSYVIPRTEHKVTKLPEGIL